MRRISALTLPTIVLGIALQACSSEVTLAVVDSDTAITVTPVTSTVSVFESSAFIKISAGEGGFTADLDRGDRFGRDHDRAGDVNGDGIIDLIIGARSDDDGATDAGAAYILFMNTDGSVGSSQKISSLQGNLGEQLVSGSFFGYGVAGIGDYNGDGIPDVAVSAPTAPIPAIYILHLHVDGTVKSKTKTSQIVGLGLTAIGDLNNDGRIDLVAAEPGGAESGLIHLLFFNQSSELMPEETVTIGEGLGGFGTGLAPNDSFGGRESAMLGDLDGDGTLELAVGAFESDNGLGAIWILSLDNETRAVVDKTKLAPGLLGFNESIPIATNPNGTTGGHFGHAMVAAGDLNGDGVQDLITSANQYDDGVVYVIYLDANKTVKSFTRINAEEGGFDLLLEPNERFGRSISIVDDNRTAGAITVYAGGSAGENGAVYGLEFQSCTYTKQGSDLFWSDGKTLFSNWNHGTQTVTTPLGFEQCVLQATKYDGSTITAKESDGRCIVKDSTPILAFSDEGSSAFSRSCP